MSCNCPKCSYNGETLSPAESAKMTNNQPKILVDELINLYCELTWKMQDIKIPVKDTAISNQAYVSILAPGTVVKFNGRRYFYSCPSAMTSLEGAWISDESTSYSTYEFLREVLNDGGCVELVLEG
nr:MAG TPA: hypothetical protein [Caudoviricetes sp.]